MFARYCRCASPLETQDTLVRHDYETLILGCALLYSDTESCVKLLKETVNRRPEWALVADTWEEQKSHRALELEDAELAKEGFGEIQGWRKRCCRIIVSLRCTTHGPIAWRFSSGTTREPYEDLAKEALECITPMLENYEDHIAGAYNIAETYGWLGDEEAAIQILKKAVGNADRGWLTFSLSILDSYGAADLMRLLGCDLSDAGANAGVFSSS